MDAQRRVQVRAGLLRLQTFLKGEGASPLDEVSVARQIAQEAQVAFAYEVRAARGAGHSWDRIAEHVPDFVPVPGDDGAQRLFESLTSASGGRSASVSWRCASCDGVVVDRGPYGGHPSDAEHGHLEECGRHRRDVEGYVAALGDVPGSAPGAVEPGDPGPVVRGIHLEIGLE